MASMQEFLNRYPNSKYKDKAIEVIYSTQEKLEKKGFDNAYLYYKMKSYKAAIVSLKNFLNNFPDSKYVEQTHYLIILSEYKQAEKSIRSKQLDRYKELVEDYKTFLAKFPQSNYLQDAEKLYADSIDKINKIKINANINS